MKLILGITIVFLFSLNTFAREVGETEITTDDGIEIYQIEKYYLLKKNVKINSDNFDLNAENVKIDFDKDLYDIIELNAEGNINFHSKEYDIKGKDEALKFLVKLEKLQVEGLGSEMFISDTKMFSDGLIKINNLNGNFSLKGLNSKLINENIFIEANSIDQLFLMM